MSEKRQIRCGEKACKATFAARAPNQRAGFCDACRTARRALAALHRRTRHATLTDSENAQLKRLERITCRVSRH